MGVPDIAADNDTISRSISNMFRVSYVTALAEEEGDSAECFIADDDGDDCCCSLEASNNSDCDPDLFSSAE